MLSFENLSQAYDVHGIEGLGEALGEWTDQEVVLRGFVSQLEDGTKVLMADPDVATCCVSNRENLASHVVLTDWPGTSPASRAINIRGRFSVALQEVNGKLEHVFRMEECCVDSSLSAAVAWLILLPALGLAVAYYMRNLLKRLPKKTTAQGSKPSGIV